MPIKVMLWNPPNAFNMGHMSIQTEEYYLSFWPLRDYKEGWKAVEKPVDASLIVHLERDIELEGCEPDEVYEITESILDGYISKPIELFLERNGIDPDSIKLHRVQERIQELERFIELIRLSPSHELDDDLIYAKYVKFRQFYKTDPDDGIDLHDEMNEVIDRIRCSNDDSTKIRNTFFPFEVPLSVTKYTVLVISESFLRILPPELRVKLSTENVNGFGDETDDEVNETNDIHLPEAMNCVTFVLFLLIVSDPGLAYPFWIIFSEEGFFGYLNHIPSWASRFLGNNRFFVIPILQFTLIFLPMINTDPSCVGYTFSNLKSIFVRSKTFLVVLLVMLAFSLIVMSYCSTSWLVVTGLQLTNSLDMMDAFNDSLFGRTLSFMKGYGPYFISYFILALFTFTVLMLFSIFANKGPRYSARSTSIEISLLTTTLIAFFSGVILPRCIPFIALIMTIFPSTFFFVFGSVLSGFFMCIRGLHFG